MRKYLLFTLCIFFISSALATHQRAAEIVYKNLGNLTYEFTLISYTYTPSLTNASRDHLKVKWGDGSQTNIPRIEVTDLEDQISYNEYAYTHTFPGPGTYTISMEDPNRNNGIVNIPNSVNIPMFIETQLTINPFLGVNNSVQLTNAPVDMGCVGKLFVHNPGAFDPDGDSISYKLANCKGAQGLKIPGFTYPKTSSIFLIDPITGDLTWDSPIIQGEYNVAFIVEEWRSGVLIGYVTRDMQIEILACDNNPPTVDYIRDTCVVAGDLLELELSASDPDGDTLVMTVSGGPFLVEENTALISPDPAIGKAHVSTLFLWNTSCEHLRHEPYQVSIKAKDKASPIQLVGFGNFNITIISPPIENLQLSPSGKNAHLSWDPFPCPNIKGYRIYRRNGPYDWVADYCETGVPKGAYALVGETQGVANTNFIDSNDDFGLLYGNEYCYRICAILPDNSDGKASEENCIHLKKEIPIITQVSNAVDSPIEGKALISWSKATDVDTIVFPKPHFYELYRELPESSYEKIAGPLAANDTIYKDLAIDLNTSTNFTKYRIDFFSESVGFIASSDQASSLAVHLSPFDESVQISIKEQVPWHLDSMTIYRKLETDDVFDSIIRVKGTQYRDKGLINDISYCYYLKTYGHYDLNGIMIPLINYSNIACVIPNDNEPPCSPSLSIETNCKEVSNTLSWNTPKGDCPLDIDYYQILYSSTSSGDFQEIAQVKGINDTVFIHKNILDVVGCYQVRAVDSAGNRSIEIASSCVGYDTCPIYELPNYFTPNGDGQNDVFYPINYDMTNPRATVSKVNMKIFNRWGRVIFETNDPQIAWTGKDQNTNNDASTGVYYYTCEVFLLTLEGNKSYNLKGIITIFR